MDTPKTLLDAARYFSDLTICNDYMRSIKWPDGRITCPKCGGEAVSEVKNRPGLHTCNKAGCRKQFSVRDDTLFADSPVPLSAWLTVVWCEACGVRIASQYLAGIIGVTQKTAWSMRAAVRAAIAEIPLPGEEWRPVLGYEGLYEASSEGRVRGCSRVRKSRSNRQAKVGARLIMPHKSKPPHNHWTITLANGCGKHTEPLHAIILSAFQWPPLAGMQCRHIDGNPDNNRLVNLEWGTAAENAADRDRHETTARGSRNAAATLTENQVREIKSRLGKHGEGKRLAKEFGVTETVISLIRRGKTWSHVR